MRRVPLLLEAFVLSPVIGLPGFAAAAADTTTITRDVAIIGGGAAGVFAATELRNRNISFVVIEKQSEFGGHTRTYTIPGTNVTIDYGVQAFASNASGDFTITQQFFGAWDVAVELFHASETGGGTTVFLDFANNFTEVANFSFSTDLSAYTALASRYGYLNYQTATPTPLPADLLLPFGQFIKKHGLEAAAYDIFYNTEGQGDFLTEPAFYVLRELGPGYLYSLLPSSPGVLITSAHYNQLPYLRAQAAFGPANALVNSTVIAAQRGDNGTRLTVNSPAGRIVVNAASVLVTCPPTSDNMAPFAPDSRESGLFSRFLASGWYAGLVNVTGLPAGVSYQNTGADTLYHLPRMPAMYQLSALHVPGIYLVRYGTPIGPVAADTIKARILDAVEGIRRAVLGADAAHGLEPAQLLAFADHAPFNLRVSAHDLRTGFYNKLAGLQGYRRTWYSGGAFFGYSSPNIWNATLGVLDSMLDS